MNNTITKISFLAFLGMTASMSHAAILFSEDFNEYTAGEPIPTGTDQTWTIRTENTTFEAIDDTSHIFSPSGNQYGQLDFDAASGAADPLASTNSSAFSEGSMTGKLSISFCTPEAQSTSGYGFLLRIGNAAGNSGTAFAMYILKNGQLRPSTTDGGMGYSFATYSLGVANQLEIVFNNSNDSVSYEGGTVASRTMDVYLNGSLVADDITSGTGGLALESNITNINFSAKTYAEAFTGTMYLNKVELSTIPESSASSNAIAIALIAALSLFIRHRYHSRRSSL